MRYPLNVWDRHFLESKGVSTDVHICKHICISWVAWTWSPSHSLYSWKWAIYKASWKRKIMRKQDWELLESVRWSKEFPCSQSIWSLSRKHVKSPGKKVFFSLLLLNAFLVVIGCWVACCSRAVVSRTSCSSSSSCRNGICRVEAFLIGFSLDRHSFLIFSCRKWSALLMLYFPLLDFQTTCFYS